MVRPRKKARIIKLKKRIRKKKKDIFLAAVLIILACYFFFLSPFFRVNKVRIRGGVEGLSLLDQLGRNIFLINSQRIESQVLNRFPEIKTARLKKILPAGLILLVEKRRPVAIWCLAAGESCFLIDSEAVLFAGRVSGEKDLLKIEGPQDESRIKPADLAKILMVSRRFKQKTDIKIEKFVWKPDNQADLKTRQGWLVRFDLNQDINLALTKLFLLLEEEISAEQLENLKYIDLRFSKVYYK